MSERLKSEMKKNLWRMWGTPEHPAEWDGNNFGGGRCSQRYWEYLFAVENLPDDVNGSSTILDIGSGASKFLPSLLRGHCRCIAVDPALAASQEDDRCQMFNAELMSSLSGVRIDAVTCISVLEHIQDQAGFMRCMDRITAPLILTFELGLSPPAFDFQLTLQSLYSFTQAVTNHYVSKMERSPVLADNSRGHWYPVGMVLLSL